ncbi:MAG: hypothetical protein QM763_17175 [Agriterribacter sp.]
MKNLILFQENTGQFEFLNSIENSDLRNLIKNFADSLAETFESIKTSLQLNGYYNRIVVLSDINCTKSKLLKEMIRQTREGNIFDLLILGHGRKNELLLHENEKMTDRDIKALLSEARKEHPGIKFNLRLVYMCNCNAATLLDSWLQIGAKTALGCKNINYMPEPQVTFFFEDFVKKGFNVIDANNRSFEGSNLAWSITGLEEVKRRGSKLSVKGENIKFDGRRLSVGELVERNIYAGTLHNYTSIYMIEGEKYQFVAASTDKWKNGSKSTNANGYAKGPFDFPRQSSHNMMSLVGEIFNDNDNVLSYTGTHFKIGTSKTWAVSKSGFLVCHANDGLPFYGDNSGKITVKIKRIL